MKHNSINKLYQRGSTWILVGLELFSFLHSTFLIKILLLAATGLLCGAFLALLTSFGLFQLFRSLLIFFQINVFARGVGTPFRTKAWLSVLLWSWLRPRGAAYHFCDLLDSPLRHRLGPRELGRLGQRREGVRGLGVRLGLVLLPLASSERTWLFQLGVRDWWLGRGRLRRVLSSRAQQLRQNKM